MFTRGETVHTPHSSRKGSRPAKQGSAVIDDQLGLPLVGKCRLCNRRLSTHASMQLGVGPTCRAREFQSRTNDMFSEA